MALEKRSKNPDNKPNKWRIRVTRNGHRYETMFFGNKKEATQAEKDFIYQIDKGLMGSNENMLFKDLYELVIEQYVKFKCRNSTLERYEITYNTHIKEHFADIPLNKIKPLTIQKWVNLLSLNYAPSSVRTYASVLQTIFRFAEEWEYISITPYRNIKLPVPEKTSHNQLMSLEDINKLIKVYFQEPPSYHKLAFFLSISCGLRNSEIRALTLNDIDFQNKLLTINKQIGSSKLEKGKNIPTKTTSSNRTIYMPDSLIPIINEYISNIPISINGQLFFSPTTNKPITKGTLTIHLKKMLKKNNLPIIRFHDLRHLHATLLVNEGINIQSISSRLGHSKTDTTLKVYSHTIDEYDKATAKHFDSILNPTKILTS